MRVNGRKGKLFGDVEFIKNSLTIFAKYACPKKKQLMKKNSLSHFTVSFRTTDLSDNIKETKKERFKSCAAFSLALDESTDMSDTALLVIFIRAVTVGLGVVGGLLDMARISSTTIGHDICGHMIRAVEKFKLNPAKLCGPTTEGAPSITGRTNGFTKKFLDVIGAQDVVVSHCIIHQENLSTEVLPFAEAMKNVVQCVN